MATLKVWLGIQKCACPPSAVFNFLTARHSTNPWISNPLGRAGKPARTRVHGVKKHCSPAPAAGCHRAVAGRRGLEAAARAFTRGSRWGAVHRTNSARWRTAQPKAAIHPTSNARIAAIAVAVAICLVTITLSHAHEARRENLATRRRFLRLIKVGPVLQHHCGRSPLAFLVVGRLDGTASWRAYQAVDAEPGREVDRLPRRNHGPRCFFGSPEQEGTEDRYDSWADG